MQNEGITDTRQDEVGARGCLAVVTDKQTAIDRPASSGSTSEVREQIGLLDMRVSNLEESLATAYQQINEKDEQLFECQQSTAEAVAQGVAQQTATMQEAYMATYNALSSSSAAKDKEIELLKARVALLETRLYGQSQSVEMTAAASEEKQ